MSFIHSKKKYLSSGIFGGVLWGGRCIGGHLKDEAIADFTEVIHLNSEYAEAYYSRGAIHQKNGDTAKANADFAKVKELGHKPDRGLGS